MIVRPKVAFIEDNNNKLYRKQMNKKKLTIRAMANFDGVKDHRRAGPPVELKILE